MQTWFSLLGYNDGVSCNKDVYLPRGTSDSIIEYFYYIEDWVKWRKRAQSGTDRILLQISTRL